MNKAVLIADGQYAAVEGIAFILKSISQDILIHRVYKESELIEKILEQDYDLLILDISLLKETCDTTMSQIKKLSPNIKVMIFTACKENLALHFLYEGAEACVYKSDDVSEIRNALYSIFKRGYYYKQELLYNFLYTKETKSLPRFRLDILSDREKEVYNFLIQGNGLLEIANLLGLHQSTVSVYKARIFKKLNLRTLVDLINYHNQKGGYPQ
ncbi:helix-turn-helix transcriptional regulator [Chryseobacterium potabilaquae]|uniref:Virulence factors putative positive transcription regulator BvgA n=1 Tax=Chryseobacterium potabilaquae TaxID=2675057 RepID=A0A6N4XEM9_9FLAO|nr:response regulator transcription factor [Chryseobacterium potabilaquae]CAA7197410.1 Virulence factors putative positive transcription regulator BvgA [Chryseobacterium potabilaquae]